MCEYFILHYSIVEMPGSKSVSLDLYFIFLQLRFINLILTNMCCVNGGAVV